MGPKKVNAADLKKGDTLQAVVIADSFDTKFGPLTNTKPRCLLPLANRPILGYTLECLKMSGVQEVFVYCTAFAHDVKKFVGEWAERQDVSVVPIINEDCHSLGDAMRDLDAKGHLRQDFILVRGDTVANVDLSAAMADHKKRCKDDKNATMTIVYKRAMPGQRCRTADRDVFLAVDGRARVLHHVRAHVAGGRKHFRFPVECVGLEGEFELRYDLLDPGVAVCTAAVPPLFADNFDCQTFDEFVQGVVQNDLTDNTIYAHVLADNGYAARVTNLHTYFEMSGDVANRLLYPMAPDTLPADRYTLHRHNVYKRPAVFLDKGSILEEDVVVGECVQIGRATVISHASIGDSCVVGNDVSIRNSIVYDGVKIGDNVRIVGSVVGKSCVVNSSAVIGEKCVLGDGVIIPAGVKVPAETWLMPEKPDDGFGDDGDDSDVTKFGPKAFVYQWDSDDDEDSGGDDDDDEKYVDKTFLAKWGSPWLGNTAQDDFNDSSSSESDDDFENADDGLDIDDDDARYEVFHREVHESLLRGYKEGVKADNLILEVNSSRHAYAVTPSQVVKSVVTVVLSISSSRAESAPQNSSKLLAAEANKSVVAFKSLLAKYIKSPTAQADCLDAIASACEAMSEFVPIVANVVHRFYDHEVLSDAEILKWNAGLEESSIIREKLAPLISWLQEDESSSEDGDA